MGEFYDMEVTIWKLSVDKARAAQRVPELRTEGTVLTRYLHGHFLVLLSPAL
jgi:hypothetical protein